MEHLWTVREHSNYKMSLNTITDLAECNIQWSENFFTNDNNCAAHPQEETDQDPMTQELLSLGLEHLPPDDLLDDMLDLSHINLEEDWTAQSILEEPLTDLTSSQGIERSELSSGKTKRRVGRPVKTEGRNVTELPTGRGVTKKTLQRARYRRMRDLNNIASQKCRLKK